MRKVPHIAFLTREALYFPSLDTSKPFLKTFVSVPKGYACSRFHVQWIESNGIPVAAVKFSMWKRRRRKPSPA